MQNERIKFLGRIRQLKRNIQAGQNIDQPLHQLAAQIEKSVAKAAQRKTSSASFIHYPESLPVSQKRDDILHCIGQHQVTIVCGETGSGKTTQLPKICLQAGLGSRGMIAHTQPRRLAARSVASRIAEEMQTELGQLIGFKVRFTDKSRPQTLVKLMTDGILLAEVLHDPYLNQYDCIIIDEAHERSLNIDFLLGYLKRLLPKRPDLKIIITSATIDPERFSRHFNNAPIVSVSGRSYPVEVRYRPMEDESGKQIQELPQAIADAVDELGREGDGDILVFLSGERDIRDAAQFLGKCNLRNTEILPLLARLSASEQNKIFHSSSKRRIVLATNVAETSLTVPGIRYVIDTGLARISRYSWRSKIQRLPIEKISQASANQRKGRCGRVADGICIRLYSEDDFQQRPEFTEPEIQRTNLASVILQMEQMKLGHVDDFPFVEPPDSRLISDGYKLLFELAAIDEKHRLTPIGKKLSQIPVDPRLARMLLEAEKESSLAEVLIIVAALATQDPRERPMDKQQAADTAQQKFKDERSDFLSLLNIWQRFESQQKKLSNNKLRQWCKQHFISWMRMREWRDTHKQISETLGKLKLRINQNEADYSSIHSALLAGLLSHIGFKHENREYLGARNRKYQIFPGSALFNKSPKWIISAEIVETTKVYARTNAKIELHWIEQKAAHLLKRSYQTPHWEKKQAQVAAFEQSTLFGLVINPKRKINYGPINPQESREIFIRSALVQGEFDCREKFFIHNRQLIEQVISLEAKSRRQDILVDDEQLFAFYDEKIPEHIYSGPAFFKWLKTLSDKQKNTLYFQADDVMRHDASHISDNDFPDHLNINGVDFPLEYHFDPSQKRDGITLISPLATVDAIDAEQCEWLVPGLLHEKMTALIRSLPKALRKNFVPAPEFARVCLENCKPGEGSLTGSMAQALFKVTGTEIPFDAWQPEQLDDHLIMNFRIMDERNKTLAEGKNLNQLLQSIKGKKPSTQKTAAQKKPANSIEQNEVDASILDSIPATFEQSIQGIKIMAYPALSREGKKVALRVFQSEQQAQQHHRQGLHQLYINQLSEQLKHLRRNLPNIQNLCLHYQSIDSCDHLKQNIIDLVIEQTFNHSPVNNQTAFEQRLVEGMESLYEDAKNWCQLLQQILSQFHSLKKQLKNPPLSWLDALSDIQQHLDSLIDKNFILQTPVEWLREYPRYLKAIQIRLDKLQDKPEQDRKFRLELNLLYEEYHKRQQQLEQKGIHSPDLEHYRWMLEEYRVSLFAQSLGTRQPVSPKRLKKLWSEIRES